MLKICYNRQDLTRAWRNDEDTGSLRYEAKKGGNVKKLKQLTNVNKCV